MFDSIPRTFSLRGDARERAKELLGNLDEAVPGAITSFDGSESMLSAEQAAGMGITTNLSAADMLLDEMGAGEEDGSVTADDFVPDEEPEVEEDVSTDDEGAQLTQPMPAAQPTQPEQPTTTESAFSIDSFDFGNFGFGNVENQPEDESDQSAGEDGDEFGEDVTFEDEDG